MQKRAFPHGSVKCWLRIFLSGVLDQNNSIVNSDDLVSGVCALQRMLQDLAVILTGGTTVRIMPSFPHTGSSLLPTGFHFKFCVELTAAVKRGMAP